MMISFGGRQAKTRDEYNASHLLAPNTWLLCIITMTISVNNTERVHAVMSMGSRHSLHRHKGS